MSSTTLPITAAAFAAALPALPLSSLHAKAAELRNSIGHLRSSNAQLEPFAAAGDADCAEAIAENELVLRRMRERIELLRREVEGRGMRWVEDEDGEGEEEREGEDGKMDGVGEGADGAGGVNGVRNEEREGVDAGRSGAGTESGPRREERRPGLTDEELARRLQERMGEMEDEDEGVHL